MAPSLALPQKSSLSSVAESEDFETATVGEMVSGACDVGAAKSMGAAKAATGQGRVESNQHYSTLLD